MVRFSLSPKITLRKEKSKRRKKKSESKENNISLKWGIDTSHCTVQLFLNHSLLVSDISS